MQDLNERISATGLNELFGDLTPALLFAKTIGALAGSLVSLAYIMPRGRREAAARLLVGVVAGLVFGGTAGVKVADTMELLDRISVFEVTLMGATLSSLSAWWGLGVLQRIIERNSTPPVRTNPSPQIRGEKSQ